VAQVAVCSEINTKHIKTVRAERTVVESWLEVFATVMCLLRSPVAMRLALLQSYFFYLSDLIVFISVWRAGRWKQFYGVRPEEDA